MQRRRGMNEGASALDRRQPLPLATREKSPVSIARPFTPSNSVVRRVKRHGMNSHQPRTLLVVIDAQKAFVHPLGSLARAYGYDEIRPGVKALAELHRFLAGCPPGLEAALIRSEYQPAQFTAGRLDHPLANLCVPTVNIDCEWADGLDVARADWVVTKRQADAMDSTEYQDLIERSIAGGIGTVWVAGFQLTTCVRATAMSMVARYRSGGVRVAVLQWLTAARASSYQPGHEPHSRVEQACSELRASGVELLQQPGDFPPY
jgi:nicotinamidase-related amidase